MKTTYKYLDPNNSQTEKQQLSKSPRYGYRKPTYDGDKYWCNCSTPTLISPFGSFLGQAHCLRCGCNWYN